MKCALFPGEVCVVKDKMNVQINTIEIGSALGQIVLCFAYKPE